MIRMIVAAALGLVSLQPGLATEPATEADEVSVAFAEMKTGRSQQAIESIQSNKAVETNDPSRLINLGTAFARMGRTQEAAKMFKAAMRSDIRYDLQLADGSMMDSKAAARLALQKLTKTLASR